MRGKTAWVVEDDEDIRTLVAAVLRDLGFDVCQAACGRDVDELFRIRLPDLVTLDLGLPDEDGLEICQRIRAASDAYIIMVTARSDESAVLTGLDMGADDYMGKPFSPASCARGCRRCSAGRDIPSRPRRRWSTWRSGSTRAATSWCAATATRRGTPASHCR